jgi:molybdopterin-guanine dinucleotide biosynthesis protein MobB
MPPIVSITGKSNSGKTTLLEALIRVLAQRGYRIAAIKHTDEEIEIDRPGKDSQRLSQAGGEVAAISSGDRLVIFRRLDNDAGPQELAQYMGADCDLILTEGFKGYPYPKIEVIRGEGAEPVSPPEQLLAIVADNPRDANVPQFNRDEVTAIADLIEQRFLTGAGDGVDLYVDNKHVPLDNAEENLLLRTLVALVSGMREKGPLRRLGIFMRRKP